MSRGPARTRLHLVSPPEAQNVVPLRLDVYLMRAAIHEGVPVTTLVQALASHGLTISTVAEIGLVIHRVGQSPLEQVPDSCPQPVS
jgi:hypothetical protein